MGLFARRRPTRRFGVLGSRLLRHSSRDRDSKPHIVYCDSYHALFRASRFPVTRNMAHPHKYRYPYSSTSTGAEEPEPYYDHDDDQLTMTSSRVDNSASPALHSARFDVPEGTPPPHLSFRSSVPLIPTPGTVSKRHPPYVRRRLFGGCRQIRESRASSLRRNPSNSAFGL